MNNSIVVKVKYRVTLSDLISAMYAYKRSDRFPVNTILGSVAILTALVELALGIYSLGFLLLALGAITLPRGYVVIASLLLYCRYRDIYENDYYVTVDTKGVHANIGALDATRSWDGYKLVVEDEKTFVFIFAKMGFFAIPKRVLSSETESQLRALVIDNTPNFRSLLTEVVGS